MDSLNTTRFPLVTNSPANPAAGADISIPITLGRKQLLNLTFTYTAANAGAARLVVVGLVRATITIWSVYASTTQAIATAYAYTLSISPVHTLLAATSPAAFMPIPAELYLQAADTLLVTALAKEATDQFSAIQYVVKDWPTISQ